MPDSVELKICESETYHQRAGRKMPVFPNRQAMPLAQRQVKNKGEVSDQTIMQNEPASVSDLFRRAQKLRAENPQLSYKEIKRRLADEFTGKPFPPVCNLTIPEQDERAPEEDWTAGLPLILRGIQQQDWKEIANGVVLCLEQTENYEQQRHPVVGDEWHDRSIGIRDPLTKGVSKWMPPGLLGITQGTPKK